MFANINQVQLFYLVCIVLGTVVVVSGFSLLPVPKEIQGQVSADKRTARQIQNPKVYRCGDMGTDKVVNFVNTNYPTDDKNGGDCRFRMVITSQHVCQIRVDFVDTELMNPVRGECLSQFLLIQGDLWQTGLPPLCGINSDQHFYLHLEPWFTNASVIDFNIVTVVRGRPYRFGLWLTQIDCSAFNALKAPEGCTQYFLAENGTIKSFNYEGYRYMNSQNYQICIRPVKGACSIQYEADESDFGFKKSISASREIMQRSGVGTEVCGTDYIFIPEGRDRAETVRRPRLLFNRRRKPASSPAPPPPPPPRARPQIVPSVDRFCGTKFSPIGGETETKPVFSLVQSNLISIRVKTSSIQEEKGSVESLNLTTGFRLTYKQLKTCPQPIVDLAVPHSIKAILDTLQWNNDGEVSQRQPSSELVDDDLASLNGQNSSETIEDDNVWDYLEQHTEDHETEDKDLYDF